MVHRASARSAGRRSEPHSVRCYLCGHGFQVGGKTASTNCPGCNRRLVVEDVVIQQLTPVKQVQTCGKLVVQRKGSIIAELVQALGGVEVRGSLDARVISGGPVVIGPAARWKGDCHAPSLSIAGGARIESGAFTVPEDFRATDQRAPGG